MTLIEAASKAAPKLKRYAASAGGEVTTCTNCAQVSVLVFQKTAASGMSTMRLK